MITINQDACTGCRKCADDCIGRYINIAHQKAVVDQDCFQCGHCVAVCPAGAISIPAYDMDDVEAYNPKTFHLNPDTLLHVIKFRRSVRRYKQNPVEADKIKMLVQAGRYSATAKNSQGCRFIIIQNELDTLKELIWNHVDTLTQRPYKEIPRELLPFIVFNKRRKEDPKDDYLFRNAPAVVYITSDWPLDAGLAAQNMELMAVSQGLGILYNGYLCRVSEHNQALKAWLGIEDTTIHACMLLGYPDVTYKRTAPRDQATVILR